MNIHHVLCDPYLVSFPFYTIPICLFLKIHRIFYLLVNLLTLVNEASDKSKGANTVVSLVHHFLTHHALGEAQSHLYEGLCLVSMSQSPRHSCSLGTQSSCLTGALAYSSSGSGELSSAASKTWLMLSIQLQM